jgi:hypothetical protein
VHAITDTPTRTRNAHATASPRIDRATTFYLHDWDNLSTKCKLPKRLQVRPGTHTHVHPITNMPTRTRNPHPTWSLMPAVTAAMSSTDMFKNWVGRSSAAHSDMSSKAVNRVCTTQHNHHQSHAPQHHMQGGRRPKRIVSPRPPPPQSDQGNVARCGVEDEGS